MSAPYPPDFSILDAMAGEIRKAKADLAEAKGAADDLPSLVRDNSFETLFFGRGEKIMSEIYRRERVLLILEGIERDAPSAWIDALTARLVVIATGGEHPAPPPVLRVALDHVARDIQAIRNRLHGLVAPGFRIALTFTESDVDDFITRNGLKDTPMNRANMRGAIEAAIESEGIMSDIREQVTDGIESERADDPSAWQEAA